MNMLSGNWPWSSPKQAEATINTSSHQNNILSQRIFTWGHVQINCTVKAMKSWSYSEYIENRRQVWNLVKFEINSKLKCPTIYLKFSLKFYLIPWTLVAWLITCLKRWRIQISKGPIFQELGRSTYEHIRCNMRRAQCHHRHRRRRRHHRHNCFGIRPHNKLVWFHNNRIHCNRGRPGISYPRLACRTAQLQSAP